MEQDFTTFYMDFTIADKFGIEVIKDTYNRAETTGGVRYV